MRRTEVSPAFVGSLALHLSVLAALLISWHFGRSINLGTVVPVTIVANAPSTDLRAAEQAPQEQTAQTPEPQPEAPPQATPPPAPEPKPQPIPRPEPRPTPAPKAEKPAKPEKTLDLDALAASLSKSTHPPKPSSAAKGPARTETALQARPDAGKGLSAAALNGLVADIERRWHPNCEVEGGRDVVIAVSFQLDEGGGVVGQVGTQITRGQGAVAQVAATRAASAVYAAAPFRNLPRDLYGQRIRANFIAQDACS